MPVSNTVVLNVDGEEFALALRVAKLYYYQGLTTEEIAVELELSRPKISRLLSFAKRQGIVQIRVVDPLEDNRSLSKALKDRYHLRAVHTVPVPDTASDAEALERVAMFTGAHLNTLVQSNGVLGLAWGTTLAAISRHLLPKPTPNLEIVQLNGSGNTGAMSDRHITDVIQQFGDNFGARVNLFPVPAFFDFAETKQALWRERSVKRIVDLQKRASVLLYSIGAIHSSVPSYVYEAGYLDTKDRKELTRQKAVGDIATVFFREDGSFSDITLNARASGPDLSVMRRAPHAVCVVAGRSKVRALEGALQGGLLSELIVDEPSARMLL
jgi:deoxyribonucleoside regulator